MQRCTPLNHAAAMLKDQSDPDLQRYLRHTYTDRPTHRQRFLAFIERFLPLVSSNDRLLSLPLFLCETNILCSVFFFFMYICIVILIFAFNTIQLQKLNLSQGGCSLSLITLQFPFNVPLSCIDSYFSAMLLYLSHLMADVEYLILSYLT